MWLGDKEVQVKPGDLVNPQEHAARRHQAGWATVQNDRNQDAAAGP